MQKHFMMIMGLTLTVGSLAHAAASSPQHKDGPPSHAGTGTPLPPQLLGQIDGILSSCKKIDPRDEDKFEKLRRTLTSGTSHSEALEKNPDYRTNFELMRSIFNSIPAADALRLCRDAVK
jgi:hypothetical protein